MSVKDLIQKHEGKFPINKTRTLIYGESGSGKTVAASTWPKPLLFIDSDHGLASVRTEVDAAPVDIWEHFFDVVKWVLQGDHDYKTIVIDSLNEVQHLSMDYIIRAFPHVKRAYQEQPGVADYGKMISDVDAMVRHLKSFEGHVVFLSQVAPRKFVTDVVQPGLIGKNTSASICRMMDLVAYLYVGEGGGEEAGRFLAFSAPDYVGKDRSGKLPPVLEIRHRDQTWQQLTEYFEEE